MNIKRNVLLNPGPATTTDTVKLAQLVPDICPREQEFADILTQMRNDLLRIVHADPNKFTSILFCGSGTMCMDVCLNSLVDDGKKVLIVNNGAYSTRAVDICKSYEIDYIDAKFDFDKLPDLVELEKILSSDCEVSLVYSTHNETGTGILNPIKEIGALAHKYGCISVVDTIASYAMLPIDIERDNIDFCMASAQKGLSSMTGLSFVIGRISEIEKSKNYLKRSYYCNLYMQYEHFKNKGEMHFTPPVQTIYATKQALAEYFEEGEATKWQRHLRVHGAIHEGLARLGFEDVIEKDWQAGLVVSVKYPNDKNWDFSKIHDYCYERGFTIYPGKISGKDTFRLCSLGSIDVGDIVDFFKVFEEGLAYFGVSMPVKYR